jgi:hypothetical protein
MKSRLAVFAWSLLVATGAFASTTNDLSDAEIQGRNLAQQLCDSRPVENFTNTGVAKIRSSEGIRYDIPVRFQTIVTATNWQVIYETTSESYRVKFVVLHSGEHTNRYQFRGNELAGDEITTPFVGDFWITDLGLEFFHWPEQKILKSEMRRGRPCKVLESVNLNPSTNGYLRVVSWIDNESNGIVHAEAYDANGKLLKEFDPKSFKKVNGQWELQDMEIRNVQTGSRTRLEFDFKKQD